jgi:tRNA(adenine34) deaminase
MRDIDWMRDALFLAQKAYAKDEVPVGAVLVSQDGVLLGSGYNQMLSLSDPTAHAEIIAIREASSSVNNYRLDGSTLYVTLEPCSMCAGAMVHARIKRLVFATRDFKAGAAGSVYNLLKGFPLNHQIQIDEGVMQKEAEELLVKFFLERRIL